MPDTAKASGSEFVEDIETLRKEYPQEGADKTAAYNRNIHARIINPLVGIPRDTLLLNVTNFCEAYGLDDKVDTFKKAALVAQNPADFESIPELSEDDKYWLRRETTRTSEDI